MQDRETYSHDHQRPTLVLCPASPQPRSRHNPACPLHSHLPSSLDASMTHAQTTCVTHLICAKLVLGTALKATEMYT